MTEPDDFGLSAAATLAHVAACAAPGGFGGFWSLWQQGVQAAPSRLNEFRAPSPDSTDASATHWIESVGHVRIGCRVIEPPRGTAVRAGLLTLHAYRNPIPLSGEDDDWEGLARRGVLVVALRLRGYAGSRMDCGDFTSEAGGWISRGLSNFGDRPQDLLDWSLPQGVADVAVASRALRAELDHRGGAGLPLMLHGWSFGGGMAVMGAAQLSAMDAGRARVHRLAVALPSLGDWAWRLGMGSRAARDGAGADVRATVVASAAREAELAARLALLDAVFHARHVACPTLALLALRDETVPAPSAAAVFNALATDPGERWRFLAPYGHFDGGIRNARRQAMFPACRDDFLDPSRRPAESMARWEPVLERGDRSP
ncbi:MAG: acetylxylan esterase [Thermoleophilia bacterium]|nr:acetylxylan esterase [Thermoleophilia bacterium]